MRVDREPGAGSGAGFVFAGRDAELERTVGLLAARPSVVIVEGEPGIGKSRLVAEVATVLRADGVEVLVGGCHPLREPLPFGPVADALRAAVPQAAQAGRLPQTVGVLADLLPDVADLLPRPSGQSEAGGHRTRVAQGVRALLAVLAPVVLVVEDLHWADDATRELVLLLARDLPRDTALLLTYRAGDLPPATALLGAPYSPSAGIAGAEIVLRPLEDADLAVMARDALGPRATTALVAALARRSGGLPLVVEEDLVTLRAGGAGESAGTLSRALEEFGVSRSLREIIGQRWARLSPAAAGLAGGAAVLAVPASERLLGRMAALPDDEALGALTEALAGSVLHELGPDRYGFAHVLAGRAVYESLPGPVRNRLHRRAVEVMRGLEVPPLVQIAHHLRQSGDAAGWLEQAEAAADQAEQMGDSGTAAALLRQVLEQPGLAPARVARVALALNRATSFGTDHEHNVASMRRILATPGLPAATRGEIRMNLGLLMYNLGGGPGGMAELAKAVPELEQGPPEPLARALSILASHAPDGGTAEYQAEQLERAMALVADSEDEENRSAVTAAYLDALGEHGDVRVPGLLEALPRVHRQPVVVRNSAMALSNAAEMSLSRGDDEEAAGHLEEAAVLAVRNDMPLTTMYTDSYRVLLRWLAGEWDAFERDLEEFRHRYPQNPLVTGGLLGTAQGVTAAARGKVAQAVRHLETALEQDGAVTMNVATAAALARIRLAADDIDGAWQALVGPPDILGFFARRDLWTNSWDLVLTAVEIHLARGDRAAAEDLVHRHAAGIEGRLASGARAEAALCRGLLTLDDRPRQAAEEFERGRVRWLGLGRPYSAALAGERAGAALAGSDPAGATARLNESLDTYRRLRAVGDEARCLHRLKALGQAPAQRVGRAGYGDRLSPREQQVRDLLVHGAANKDIAVTLFLSPRTVEHHVAAVLRKLATTREQLIESSDPPKP
ncbi:AAA family ATPase [Kitasatospora purpeofusca]|uniref:helix-turn-helix transcriptional regulator n=1 Tax=Kitasatospora purpeofusca TaxID=67352 RepID=UPI0030F1C024